MTSPLSSGSTPRRPTRKHLYRDSDLGRFGLEAHSVRKQRLDLQFYIEFRLDFEVDMACYMQLYLDPDLHPVAREVGPHCRYSSCLHLPACWCPIRCLFQSRDFSP